MIGELIALDKELFLLVNGAHNASLDLIMWYASQKFIWLPLYISLAAVVLRKHGVKSVFIFLAVAFIILISDQISSSLLKEFIHRLRPSHNPEFSGVIHLVNGYKGGAFGFVSSHAANTMALSTFIFLIIRKNWVIYIMGFYLLVNCYSRMYLGVHYPLDIAGGIIVGFLSAVIVYFPFRKLAKV